MVRVRRGRRRGRCVAFAATALLASSGAACSSDDEGVASTTVAATPIAEGEAPLRVELIDDAVTAVEAAMGGPQRFFEVNATPTIVNLFVATENGTQAVAYVFVGGVLEDPAPPKPASGPTFGSADIDFDTQAVLSQVRAQLPSVEFRLFSITGLDTAGVQYQVVVESSRGAELVVFVSSTGAVLGTDQDLGIGDS